LGTLFPYTRQLIEEEVLQRAVELDEVYRHRSDRDARLKQNFLNELVGRVGNDPPP
jgi:hypothetical protein